MLTQPLMRTALFLIVLLETAPVWAQTDSRLAVGASVTTRVAASEDASNGAAVGFEWRLGYSVPGWGVQNSIFGWFDSDVQGTIGPNQVALGAIRVRPLMAGYGYTWVRKRTAITAALLAGYSLNSFRFDEAALQEYASRLGATGVEAEATNAFAIKPGVLIWHDLNRLFGLKVEAGYLFERPSVVIRSSLGEDVRPINADTILLTVGLVYSLF